MLFPGGFVPAMSARMTYNRTIEDGRHGLVGTKASPSIAPFAEMRPRNVKAALRLQMAMFEVLHDVGRDWLKRAASEAELALNLPNKLTGHKRCPAHCRRIRNGWASG